MKKALLGSRAFSRFSQQGNKMGGFTLAEVLITLGIIGVVAAITIPLLKNAADEIQFKSAWKKEFAVFSQAYEQVKQDEGGDLSAYFGGTTYEITLPLFLNLLPAKLLLYKNCGTDYSVCGTNPAVDLTTNDTYKTLSNSYVNYNNLVMAQYILQDGANVYVRAYDVNYSFVWVDVNGYAKKPNTLGKDLFCMIVTKDKIMPCGAQGTGVEDTCNTTEKTCPAAYGFHGTGSCAGAGCSSEYLYK